MFYEKLQKKEVLKEGGKPLIYVVNEGFVYYKDKKEFCVKKYDFISNIESTSWKFSEKVKGLSFLGNKLIINAYKRLKIINEDDTFYELSSIGEFYFENQLQFIDEKLLMYTTDKNALYSLKTQSISWEFTREGASFIVNKNIITCTREGMILCREEYIDAPIWTLNFAEFDFLKASYYAWKILNLSGNYIIVSVSNYYLIALNYKTGEVLWSRETIDKKAEELLGAKYTLLGHHFKKVPNKNELVTLQGQGLFLCVDIKTGATLEARLDDKTFKELDISADADIAINEKYIYFYQMDGNIGVYEMETGKIVATYDMKKDKAPLVVMSSPRLHNGHFFIMDELGRLHIFEEFKK